MKNKDQSIENLRGLAIVMMVAGHVIGNNISRGMNVADDSFLRHFYYTLVAFRVPLFTVISGYVYAMRPLDLKDTTLFVKGKLRRLGLPLICASTLHFLVQYFVPNTHANHSLNAIWKIYFFSYEHYWFLQAILLVFLFVILIEYFKFMQTLKRWLALLVTVLILRELFLVELVFFSLSSAMYLLPFFILGCGLKRFNSFLKIHRRKIFSWACLVSFLALGYQQLCWYSSTLPLVVPTSCIGIIIGMSFNIFLVLIKQRFKYLSFLGSYAFSIYLYHVFGIAIMRLVLYRLGVESYGVHFLLGLFMGLLLPIFFQQILERQALLRLCFLGLKK